MKTEERTRRKTKEPRDYKPRQIRGNIKAHQLKTQQVCTNMTKEPRTRKDPMKTKGHNKPDRRSSKGHSPQPREQYERENRKREKNSQRQPRTEQVKRKGFRTLEPEEQYEGQRKQEKKSPTIAPNKSRQRRTPKIRTKTRKTRKNDQFENIDHQTWRIGRGVSTKNRRNNKGEKIGRGDSTKSRRNNKGEKSEEEI